ncbi:MAG TPA: GAF domain-containing protein [Actinomycetales bacterium]|nr:GAF domain-containing protein [Actinomycetales bacterium]
MTEPQPLETTSARLLEAVLGLTAELELPALLRRFVDAARELTGARFAAMNVFDSRGRLDTFVHSGVDERTAELIGTIPHGLGVLGAIPSHGALKLDDVANHPAFRGWPAHHPQMHTFLGVAVRVRDQVYGDVYLANKLGSNEAGETVSIPFTDADAAIIKALAAAAAVAIENAQLYEARTQRVRWIAAGQEITTHLLEGADEEDVLETIAVKAREVAAADAVALVLPSIGDEWILEIADGEGTHDLIGTVMPPEGRSMRVLESGHGMVVDSLSRTRILRVPALRRYGPALYAPMVTSGRSVGVLIMFRNVGEKEFVELDLTTAESFAAQAALALVLAEARHAQDVAALFDERERIARDLHDLAIQQLFATGMQLETIRRRAEGGIVPAELETVVEDALDSVDSTVRQIRAIVHSLRDPDADVGIVERLRRETSLARTGLGFAPSLVLRIRGRVIDSDDGLESDVDLADEIVGPELSDDVVAVVREGLANAARHAQASSVHVTVEIGAPDDGDPADNSVYVSVEDDGVGLPESATRSSGLSNLAARARQHGGTFEARVGTERGSILEWRVPPR